MRRYELSEKVKKDILTGLMNRNPSQYGEYEATVDSILADVRERGDKALFEYTEKFDKVKIDGKNILVTEEEFEEAYREVDSELVEVIRRAKANIESFHRKQLRNTFVDMDREGIMLGQRIIPMARAGVYVPGGKAAYPSSVLMNVIPAKTAGVGEIVMTTPPAKDGRVYAQTLVAAREAGADKVFKIGGAQAIAALAFGTESVPRVDKIVGPGNIFVALAKKRVYGHVSIDSIAGPSEILVVADETANPRFVAADLISQAEHDELACATLITTSAELADAVEKEIAGFLKTLSRREIIEKSLENYGFILIAKDIREAC
ncbi:MAG: histidinol dehydrogenase, partial [Lachnospiraceae bacterium]|nr:histidinol dehydrogenase [Lachnospiraceae bacterium]